MNARILAPVALLLCLALFFAWRSTSTTPRLAVPAPAVQDEIASIAPDEHLTPSTRAPVIETARAPGDVPAVAAHVGCTIHGRIVDQNGAPVSLHDVWLRTADRRTPVTFSFLPEGSDAHIAKSDAMGHFTFDGIASGTWWIGPAFVGGGIEAPTERIAAYGQVLVVEESTHDVDLLIRAGRGLYLRGVLLDRRGNHARTGLVRARDLESTLQSYTSVNKAGMFELGPLRPGRYELSGWSREGDAPSEPIVVSAGDEDLELAMHAGAELSGVIADENGQHVFASLRIVRRGAMSFPSPVLESLRDGTFRVPGLEMGIYDIVATTQNGRIGAIGPIRLASAERASDLVVDIAPGGTVRVRYEGHDPVGTASVIQDGMTIASIELPRGVVQDFTARRGRATVRIELLESGRDLERSCDVIVGKTARVFIEAAED